MNLNYYDFTFISWKNNAIKIEQVYIFLSLYVYAWLGEPIVFLDYSWSSKFCFKANIKSFIMNNWRDDVQGVITRAPIISHPAVLLLVQHLS